jgi:hypothetical protein
VARRPASTGVRLTRRGRIVVRTLIMVAILLVLGLAWLVGSARAQAAGSGPSSKAFYRGLTAMVVHPGQSLWSIAQQAQPSADPRVVVQQIIDINALPSSTVQTGERLWVPKG